VRHAPVTRGGACALWRGIGGDSPGPRVRSCRHGNGKTANAKGLLEALALGKRRILTCAWSAVDRHTEDMRAVFQPGEAVRAARLFAC